MSGARWLGPSTWLGAGRACFIVALAAAAWSLVTVLTGGFVLSFGTLRLSARDPFRPVIVVLACGAIARAALGAGEFRRHAASVTGSTVAAAAARIAALTAVSVLVAAAAWNTWAAGGSDSSCYVLQAEAFAHGRAALDRPLAGMLPDATPATFAPAGFVPSRRAPGDPVPICSPGLALAMVVPYLLHRNAVFLVVPACAALATWLTFVLGRQLDDRVTGAAAAMLLACSPIFLYQSVQPMSDVPAAAAWLATLTAIARGDRRGDLVAGICASMAILIRVNLALVMVPLASVLLRRGDVAPARRRWLWFALGLAPGLALMLALNILRYGAPLASGYGSTEVLFSFGHLAANLARYPRWLLATETPIVLLACAAPWSLPRQRPLALAALASVLLLAVTYLTYTVFDDWWYLRFLLPALPIVLVFSVATLLGAAARLAANAAAARVTAAILLCAALMPWYLHVARARAAFDLQSLESRFLTTARYAADALPEGAVVLAVQQSGSIRYHGRRTTLAWDGVREDALDATIERLSAGGRPVYLALEDEERARFRQRFGTARHGQLDWPPVADIHARVGVRIFAAADRARFLRGERIGTQVIR
jgi:hypothetical protein